MGIPDLGVGRVGRAPDVVVRGGLRLFFRDFCPVKKFRIAEKRCTEVLTDGELWGELAALWASVATLGVHKSCHGRQRKW